MDTDTDTDKVDVYMPFFVGDYLKDTTHLTCEEHGAYFKLLCTLWTKRGYLRFDHKRLALVVGLDSERWRIVWETLEPFFQVVDGLLSQKGQLRRLEESRRLKRVRRESGSKGGRASGEARRSRAEANGEADVKQTASVASSNREANGEANAPAKTNPSPSPSPSPSESDSPGETRARAQDPPAGATEHVPPPTPAAGKNGRHPTSHDVLEWFGLEWRGRYHRWWKPDRGASDAARDLLEREIPSLPPQEAAAASGDIRPRISRYLADSDDKLVKHCHPFKWFCDRFNALAEVKDERAANGGHTRKLFTGVEPR